MHRHDSYKPSGVKWLGDVPSHWGVQALRAVTQLKSDRNRPDLPVLSVYREYGVIRKDSRDDNHNATSLDTSTYKVVKPGDLVVNKMKAWQGSMGVSAHEGIVSPAYITCATKSERVLPGYLHYLLRSSSLIGVYNSLSYGVRVGQWDMHYEDFKQIRIPLPPMEEQDRIVMFLDQKSAEIEKAIAKKEQIVELLREQREILIDKWITGDGDQFSGATPVKATDIGNIPNHWKIQPLKHLLRTPLQYGANEEAKDQDINSPRYIRITDFGDDGMLKDDSFRSLPMKKAKDYLLTDGDILFARSGATVGKTYIFKSLGTVACFAGYLIRAEADKSKVLSEYLYAFTKSPTFSRWKNQNFSISTIQNIGADKYANLPVFVPPMEEQRAIVKRMEDTSKIFSSVIDSITSEILALKKMKSLTISNVVAGKIKV